MKSSVATAFVIAIAGLLTLAACGGTTEVPTPPAANAHVDLSQCAAALSFLRQTEGMEYGNNYSYADAVALNAQMAQSLTAMGNDTGNSEPWATVNRLMNDIGKQGNPYPDVMTMTQNAITEVKKECVS